MFLTYSSLASCTRIMGHTTKCENISKLQTLLHSGLLPGQNWAEQIQINSRKLPECVSIHSSLWGAHETIFHTENIQRYTSIWHAAAAKLTNISDTGTWTLLEIACSKCSGFPFIESIMWIKRQCFSLSFSSSCTMHICLLIFALLACTCYWCLFVSVVANKWIYSASYGPFCFRYIHNKLMSGRRCVTMCSVWSIWCWIY